MATTEEGFKHSIFVYELISIDLERREIINYRTRLNQDIRSRLESSGEMARRERRLYFYSTCQLHHVLQLLILPVLFLLPVSQQKAVRSTG